MAFAITTIYCVAIPLHFFAAFPWGEALLIAFIIGLLLTLVEALAWRGLDNLLIPVVGFGLLKFLVGLSPFGLTFCLISGALLGQAVVLWREQIPDLSHRWLDLALMGWRIC
jgi:phytol kinase